MQAIRQLMDIQQLKGVIDIPEYFTANKVEIFIFPVADDLKTKQGFNPEDFFGVSHLKNIDEQLEVMRNEWKY